MAAIFMVYVILYRHPHLPKYLSQPVIGLLMLHSAWIVVACVYSSQPLVSLKFLAAKTWYLAAFFGMTAILIRDTTVFKKVFWIIHLSIITCILIVLFRHIILKLSFEEVNQAVSVLFRNHVNYGVFIAMWLPWQIMAFNWYKNGSLARLFLGVTILLTLVAIYFSYTRGAWLAVTVLPLYFLVVKYRLTKWLFAVLAIAMLVFGLYLHKNYNYLKYAPNYETTIYHNDLSEHLGSTLSGEDMSTMERFHRWVGAARMATEKPLTGYGPGNFARYYKPYTVTSFSTYISDNEEMSTVHNYFLLMLTEQGFIGLLIFVIFSVVLFIQGEKLWHSGIATADKMIVMGLLCCMAVFYINNFFSDLFESNKLAPLFFISLAILVNIRAGFFNIKKMEKLT